MSRSLHYNRAVYTMMRELAIVRSPTLSLYFKDVFVPPYIKERIEAFKKRRR